MNDLSFFRVPFGSDVSVGGNLEEAKLIFELAGGCVYLEYEPYYDEDNSFRQMMIEKLNYYCRDLKLKEYNCEFFENFTPKFQILDYNIYDINYNYPSDHILIKVDDFKTFVFFLTTNEDDHLSIFSSDFDRAFFKTYLVDYYKNIEKYEGMTSYQYILEKHKSYISQKAFIFYDTYADDENDNYLFITGNEKIKKMTEQFFSSIAKDI